MGQKGLKMHEERQKIEFLDLKNLPFSGIFLTGIRGYPPPPLNGKSCCPKTLSGNGGYPPLNGKIPLSRFLKGSLNSWSILLIFEDILLIFRDLLLILGDILLIFEDILSFFGGRHFIGGISLILGGRQFIGGILLIFGDILLISSYLVVKANTNQI